MNVIEKMAQAMAAASNFKFEGFGEATRQKYLNQADAAYAAMMQHLAETGQVIVPEEPSDDTVRDICAAIEEAHTAPISAEDAPYWGAWWEAEAINAYRAMIAAAKDQA